MANTFVFTCEKCGQAIYSKSVKEGKKKLEKHKCFDEKAIDYGNMPMDEFVTLIKERMSKC